MEQALIEMVKNAPWAAALILIVRMFLQAEKEREIQRSADAKESGDTRRAHEEQMERIRHGRELEVNNLWATTVKNVMEKQTEVGTEITSVLHDVKNTLVEQYKNIGITQELFKMAKQRIDRIEKIKE